MSQTLTYFPGQKTDEKIKIIVGKHWIVHLKSALNFLFLFILPAALFLSAIITFPDFFSTVAGKTSTVLMLTYCLFALINVYNKFLNDAMDVIIITDHRIIGIDQVGYLKRRISETPITQVQDVECEQVGTLANIFDYGAIEVQTAADKITFSITHADKPQAACRHILDIKDILAQPKQQKASH